MPTRSFARLLALGSVLLAVGCSAPHQEEEVDAQDSAIAKTPTADDAAAVTVENTIFADGSMTKARTVIPGARQAEFRALSSKINWFTRNLGTWSAIKRSHLGSDDPIFTSVKVSPSFDSILPGMKVVASFPKEEFTRSAFTIDLQLKDVIENKAFTIESTSDLVGPDGEAFGAMDPGGWSTRIEVTELPTGLELRVASTVHVKRLVERAPMLSGFAQSLAEHFRAQLKR